MEQEVRVRGSVLTLSFRLGFGFTCGAVVAGGLIATISHIVGLLF